MAGGETAGDAIDADLEIEEMQRKVHYFNFFNEKLNGF